MQLNGTDLAALDLMVKNLKTNFGIMVSAKVLAKVIDSLPEDSFGYFERWDSSYRVVLNKLLADSNVLLEWPTCARDYGYVKAFTERVSKASYRLTFALVPKWSEKMNLGWAKTSLEPYGHHLELVKISGP